MKKGKFSDEDIEKAKIAYISSFKELYDDPFAIIKNMLAHEHIKTDLIEDSIKNIKLVNKENIMNVGANVHLDTIYLLEGGKNEENWI